MRFACTISRRGASWSARHDGTDIGPVEVTAPTREEAAEKLRREIRYRLEICPCSGARYESIDIELVER